MQDQINHLTHCLTDAIEASNVLAEENKVLKLNQEMMHTHMGKISERLESLTEIVGKVVDTNVIHAEHIEQLATTDAHTVQIINELINSVSR